MPTFDFRFDLSAVVTGAAKIAIILAVTLILLLIARRLVPRIIRLRIPRIREETPDQLAVRSTTLSRVLLQVFSAVLWLIAVLMMLSVVGVNITPVLAAVGVAALAVGFAAQNLVRDYLHGFFIVMEDWYRVGEVATVSGIGGLVEDVNLRRTVLRDINGTKHYIPNNKVELASNMTRDWARINLNVSVAYKEDLSRVFEVINEVCQEVKDDPAWGQHMLTTPSVLRVDNLGDNGVDIKILGDTKPIQQWALMGELRKRLKDRFDQEGIEIPWPHTKVYFGSSPPNDDGNGSVPR
ncbi:MAG: mechanosensitive ion channel family protein [Chloroflexota bacterium]|nr:mechanosensitive ion channel family protein [Chloroflexota bacterium]